MRINIDKKSLMYVAIYFLIFFLCAFLGAKFWPNGVTVENQPVEIKHSPEYYESLIDYYKTQDGIDKYIESLENRIRYLEDNPYVPRATFETQKPTRTPNQTLNPPSWLK